MFDITNAKVYACQYISWYMTFKYMYYVNQLSIPCYKCSIFKSFIMFSVCNCNFTGTEPCERVYGQCGCKPGVTGRQCDRCDRLYINFGLTGCESKLLHRIAQIAGSALKFYFYSSES